MRQVQPNKQEKARDGEYSNRSGTIRVVALDGKLMSAKKKNIVNACENADKISRSVVKRVALEDPKSSGVTKKLECFQGKSKRKDATIFKGGEWAMKRKKTADHVLTKEREDSLSHLLLGEDLTPEERNEEIMSLGTVLPGGLATMEKVSAQSAWTRGDAHFIPMCTLASSRIQILLSYSN